MSTAIALVLTLAGLSWLSLWLSVRAAPLAEVQDLPLRYRRRVQWCVANAGHVQLGCLAVIVAAGAVALSQAIG